MAALAVGADESSAEEAAESAGLTHHTAHGFAWMLGQALVTKVTSFLGQIAIAKFLSPDDFDVVMLVYSAASFPGILRDAGLQAILVQRQRHLGRWANPVFWMSIALGLLTGLIMAGISPFVAHFYHEPKLVPLLCIMAAGNVVSAAGTVPQAVAQVRLRFRFLSVQTLLMALLTTGLNILFAWWGWGAYSFIVPLALVGALRTVWLWAAVYQPVHWRLDFKRWRFLMGDSGMLLLIQLLYITVANGDYLILGARYRDNKEIGGQFYFAYQLSWQALVLLTVNMAGVLFPALSKLASDPARQAQAYLRSARLLALIGVPACFLQAAVAGPGMHLVFKEKWFPAIPIVQVLSLAMAVRSVGLTYFNYASAQGRFKLQAQTSAVTCVLFLIVVWLAALRGHGLAVAVAEGIFFCVTDPLWLWVALRRDVANPLSEIARIYFPPLIAGVVAVGAAFAAAQYLPDGKMGEVLQIAVMTLITAAIYLPLIRWLAREPWDELLKLAGRFRP